MPLLQESFNEKMGTHTGLEREKWEILVPGILILRCISVN